jgi:hypothetical protein
MKTERRRIPLKLPESEIELARLLKDAAQVASVQALVSMGAISPYASLHECRREYGIGTVNNWLRQGLIRKIKDGEGNTKVRISRVELEAAARTSNRVEWYVDRYETKKSDSKIRISRARRLVENPENE